jgi:transcriptional regulator with XRE-family HTH domain
MAGQNNSREGSSISPDLLARIVRLSELTWKGNRSQMGRDLGIDQAAVSRVLAGKQQPSAKLLERLATWPGVNVVWLLSGHGQPLIEGGARAGDGPDLPLVEELLPGPPGDHPERLSGAGHPVAPRFHSPTAYWYRVQAGTPLTRDRKDLVAGDLLFMEAGEAWTRRAEAVRGRLCGFRVRTGRKERVLWGAVSLAPDAYFESYEPYRVDLFGEAGQAVLVIPDAPSGLEEARRAASGACLTLDQVACVCVRLERTFARPEVHDRRAQ